MLGTLINIHSGRMSSVAVFAVLVVLSVLGVALHAAVLLSARWRPAWQRNPGGR